MLRHRSSFKKLYIRRGLLSLPQWKFRKSRERHGMSIQTIDLTNLCNSFRPRNCRIYASSQFYSQAPLIWAVMGFLSPNKPNLSKSGNSRFSNQLSYNRLESNLGIWILVNRIYYQTFHRPIIHANLDYFMQYYNLHRQTFTIASFLLRNVNYFNRIKHEFMRLMFLFTQNFI